MNYTERTQDLFALPKDYHLAHCISADAKLGAGIAVQFKRHFNLRQLTTLAKQRRLYVGSCCQIDRVYNLITKPNYWNKPTYDTLRRSLEHMKNMAVKHDVTKIGMPAIGAGLDRLDWDQNRTIIKDIFKDTNIEITVCFL